MNGVVKQEFCMSKTPGDGWVSLVVSVHVSLLAFPHLGPIILVTTDRTVKSGHLRSITIWLHPHTQKLLDSRVIINWIISFEILALSHAADKFWVNGPAHTLRRLSCSLENPLIEWAVSSGWFKTFIHTVEADVWHWTLLPMEFDLECGVLREEWGLKVQFFYTSFFSLLGQQPPPHPPNTSI